MLFSTKWHFIKHEYIFLDHPSANYTYLKYFSSPNFNPFQSSFSPLQKKHLIYVFPLYYFLGPHYFLMFD